MMSDTQKRSQDALAFSTSKPANISSILVQILLCITRYCVAMSFQNWYHSYDAIDRIICLGILSKVSILTFVLSRNDGCLLHY